MGGQGKRGLTSPHHEKQPQFLPRGPSQAVGLAVPTAVLPVLYTGQ